MTLTFRDEKGSNLTSAEQDTNVRDLRDMILDLINNPVPGVGVVDIDQDPPGSSVITINLSNGSSTEVTLPRSNLRYRSDWTPETAYLIGDWVRVEDDGIYLVRVAHDSELVFDPGFQVLGEDAYELAIPFFDSPAGWEPIAVVVGETEMDLLVSDKFLLTVDAVVEIQAPINGYNGQPFALRIQMSGAHAVTFAAEFLGEAPEVAEGVGDETVLGGMILDIDPALTAVINTVKTILA